MTSCCGRAALGFEPGHARRWRNAVERHVDERRDDAGGCGPRRVLEPFPLIATGIVDVHVRVDEARTDDESTGVDFERVIRTINPGLTARRESDDAAVAHVDRGWPDPLRQDDAIAADDERP